MTALPSVSRSSLAVASLDIGRVLADCDGVSFRSAPDQSLPSPCVLASVRPADTIVSSCGPKSDGRGWRLEMGIEKSVWQTPELTVLARCKPEEAVLAARKGNGATPGPNGNGNSCRVKGESLQHCRGVLALRTRCLRLRSHGEAACGLSRSSGGLCRP